MSREFKYKDVLQAWMDGKDIQFRSSCINWTDYLPKDVPPVNNQTHEWRVKPQTRTVWVNVYKSYDGAYWTGGIVFTDEESAKSRSRLPEYITTISIEEEIV